MIRAMWRKIRFIRLKVKKGSGQNGFTLLELIISITLSAMIAAFAGQLIATGADTYSYVKSRQSGLRNGRNAFKRIMLELRSTAGKSGISEADSTRLVFANYDGESRTISLDVTRLLLDGSILAEGVEKFRFRYFDNENVELISPVQETRSIFLIKFNLELNENGHRMKLSSDVTPRNF